MGINKVQYGNTVLIDLTDATATADKILQGYTAYGADGSKLTGTATGGGGGGSVTQDQDGFIVLPPDGGSSPSVGGLEYETGTWTPSEDVNHPTINFSDSHSTLPFYVAIYDTTNTAHGTNDILYWALINHYGLYGEIAASTSTTWYGRVQCSYMTGGAAGTSGINISQLTGSASSCMPYYLATDSFSPVAGSSIFVSGRTYKWIAVWAPTT